jgi:hypothetical protein
LVKEDGRRSARKDRIELRSAEGVGVETTVDQSFVRSLIGRGFAAGERVFSDISRFVGPVIAHHVSG